LTRRFGSASAGAGTVLVATVIWLSLLLAAGVALVAGYAAAAQKANAAADLVALSGAAAQESGEGACRGAARLAQANGVRLVSCRVAGDILEFAVAVQIEFPIPRALPGLPDHLLASATAGRSDSESGSG
jgi:secretion/DNA translocation related TadE-like protein